MSGGVRRAVRLTLLRFCGRLLQRRVPSATVVPSGDLRVLVIRPDHLGDVLLSRPAIDTLAATLPRARLTVAVGSWGRPALGSQANWKLLICPFPGFGRSPIGPLQPYLLLLRYRVLLRQTGPYDLALILRPDHWWGALLACLCGIPVRVGYATPETLPFLTVAEQLIPGRHAVEEALRLVAAAAACAGSRIDDEVRKGASDVWPTLPRVASATDERALAALLREVGVRDGVPLLVLHPGSGSSLKSWSLARLAAAGTTLAGTLNASVLVTGSASEQVLAQRLCDLVPGAISMAGRLSWGELEALLQRAMLIIGVDSGPLHLAVAAGTPSVTLFGPADPAQFAPWGPTARHRVILADLPCRPCRRLDCCWIEPQSSGVPPCMRAITTDMAVKAALAALQEGRHTSAADH